MRLPVYFHHLGRPRLRLPLIIFFAATILIVLLRRNYMAEERYILGPNLLHHYRVDEQSDKEAVDFFLNVRKLTLWAVGELNQRVKETYSNESEIPNVWWCDPTRTADLRSAPFKDGFIHEVVFLADPGHVPFNAKIFQRNVTSPETEELTIVGEFTRLAAQGGVADVAEEPPAGLHQTHNEYFKEDNLFDPELTTWHREKSFMVPDFVDFQAERGKLYPMTPGEKNNAQPGERYCRKSLRMLIMVSSPPPHFENRRTIRDTYGSESNLASKQVRLVFLFGRVMNETLQSLLKQEADEYDDIIQADFMDSYHNLSLSHLLMYNWVQTTSRGSVFQNGCSKQMTISSLI